MPRPNEVFFCRETDDNDLETIDCKCWIIGVSHEQVDETWRAATEAGAAGTNASDVGKHGTGSEASAAGVSTASAARAAAEILKVDEMTSQLGKEYIGYGERLAKQGKARRDLGGSGGVSS